MVDDTELTEVGLEPCVDQSPHASSSQVQEPAPSRRKYSKAPGSKRTKTGCLTCRKRRVKCTEEKPACQNCIKAKRACAGYIQELKFKDPVIHHAQPWSAAEPVFAIQFTPIEAHAEDARRAGRDGQTGRTRPHESLAGSSIARAEQDDCTGSHGVIASEQHTSVESSTASSPPARTAMGNAPIAKLYAHPSEVEEPSLAYQVDFDAQSPQVSLPATAAGLQWDARMTCALESRAAVLGSPISEPGDDPSRLGPTRARMSHSPDQGAAAYFDASEAGAHGGVLDDYRSPSNEMTYIMAARLNQDSLELRSYHAFINAPNMLATYAPSYQASPLQDPMVARVFCHFINVTGPSMSMFERNPADASLMFQGRTIPREQQHIWTHTFPAMALQNQAVMQAILAVGSLHIARLQNESLMPSLKHYAFALRRIAKAVAQSARRTEPATLAAAILLAYYELWTADHAKWINHLLGATQLVKDIDFSSIESSIAQTHAMQGIEPATTTFYEQHQLTRNDVDRRIVSVLLGKPSNPNSPDDGFAQQARVAPAGRSYSRKEIDDFEDQTDLWWCYARQDAYQSILGGGPLFVPLQAWDRCLPRAPIGRLSAPFGTFDHLVLLLARLGEFIAKDAKRKRLALKAHGVFWRLPGMPATSAREAGVAAAPRAPPPPMPDFDGMIPGMTDPKPPMGFSANEESPAFSPSYGTGEDLYEAGIRAEEEWQSLRAAFNIFESALGSDFQALSPEFCAPIDTPFGPALQYRTYCIAGIWLNYYMGLIACHRAHPSMPPAAMMAAGLAASQTSTYATDLGRIAGGIAPDCHTKSEVSPAIGAALVESATTMFVGSVQLQETRQRDWVVQRLLDIARLTGFQTALAIASGCEAAWVKRAEVGRGPPYSRKTHASEYADVTHVRRIDRTFEAMGDGSKLVVKSGHRAHFALGLLGMADDFQRLDLQDDHDSRSRQGPGSAT